MKMFYRKNFIFHAERYEEWFAGTCISQGPIDVIITSNVLANGRVKFDISGSFNLNIKKSFWFDDFGEDFEILHDRIQYCNSEGSTENNHPQICNIFTDGYTIACVRFAMSYPDRLIEFYGAVTEQSASDVDVIPSKDMILKLVKEINHVKEQVWNISRRTGNRELLTIAHTMEVYLNPLYYAWQKLGYGWHSDFWEEGDSMFEYMMYEVKVKEVTTDLLKLLKQSSPFAIIDRMDKITPDLIIVCNYILKNE